MRSQFFFKFRSAVTVETGAGDSRAELRESLLPEANIQRDGVDGHYSVSRKSNLSIGLCVPRAMAGQAFIAPVGLEMHR